MEIMNNLKGIEGDFIETKENLIFDVKGIHHPKDRKICYIRFYPNDLTGDRIKNSIRYKKIYDLSERYLYLKENYPKYLFYSKEFDLEVQGVKNEDIQFVYTPGEYFKSLYHKSDLSKIERISKELCELFISEGEIQFNSIGITGSPMVGLNNNSSDIDLIIYGTDISLEFQDKLYQIFEKSGECKRYNLHEFQTNYERRVGGSNVPFDEFLECEKRKLHQGVYKGYEFFIRYLKSPKDWQGEYYDYKYKNHGRIKLKAEIIDDTDSIFTPCSYKIDVIKIIENGLASNDYIIEDIIEVNSFRGRYCEQAKKGEIVLVEGKLEKVLFRNKEYYRILLTEQVKDKILILKS